MDRDLERVVESLQAAFPDVDAREVRSLVVSSYRLVTRATRQRHVDKVEAVCRLRLHARLHPDAYTLGSLSSLVRSGLPAGPISQHLARL